MSRITETAHKEPVPARSHIAVNGVPLHNAVSHTCFFQFNHFVAVRVCIYKPGYTTSFTMEDILMMQQMTFTEATSRMQPGDVVAFGGSSHFSGIIKMAIRAEVSHIGILLSTGQQQNAPEGVTHYIIDSTSRQGVAISRLQDRVDEYDGEVWWLPLHQELRNKHFNYDAFAHFLRNQDGKKYDHSQAAGSAIDFFDTIHLPFTPELFIKFPAFKGFRKFINNSDKMHGPGYNHEDFERFFCSELVAAGLKAAGVLPAEVNASEATPIDICRWHIFAPEYYLLKGESAKEISGYNSRSLTASGFLSPSGNQDPNAA